MYDLQYVKFTYWYFTEFWSQSLRLSQLEDFAAQVSFWYIKNQVSGSVNRRIEATYQSQNSIEFPVRTCNDLRLVFTCLYTCLTLDSWMKVVLLCSIVFIYMIPFKAACFDGPETPDATDAADIRHFRSWVIESLNVVEDRQWGGSEEASGM